MLAVVVAFRQEIGDFLKAGGFREINRAGRLRFYASATAPGVVIAEGGFGREGVTDSVRRVSAKFAPDAIICAGFSAGATAGQAPGEVVVGSRAIAVEGPPDAWTPNSARVIETGRATLDAVRAALAGSNAKYAVAPCLTAPAFVSDPATKRRLGITFGASAIDMESYWAAKEAARCGTPCLPIRVILDPVDQSVSWLVETTLEDTRLRRAIRSAGYLVKHPRETPELLRLSRQAKLSAKSLSHFMPQLLHIRFSVG